MTCEDIDECEVDSPCSHICENTERRLDELLVRHSFVNLFFLPHQFSLQMSRGFHPRQ